MQAKRPKGRAGQVHDAFYKTNSKYFLLVNDILAVATIVSVLAIILETVPVLDTYTWLFNTIEVLAVVIFSVEYVARIYANQRRVRSYTLSFFGIIDLLAILPSYFGLTNLTFLKSVRTLRILRLLRMLRLAKLAKPRREKGKETDLDAMSVQIYVAALIASVVMFGTLIYVFESAYVEFSSIPHGMIWAVKVTLGGIPQYMPHTVWGELVTIGARFTGLLLFGLLISIVGSGTKRVLLGDE
jgi:voltage-gated potassium channel